MDIIYEIRRRHAVQKQTVSDIAREMGLSRPTVRKHLNTVEEPQYERKQPVSPMLGRFESQLTAWLVEEAKLPRQRRRTAHRLFGGLQELGYVGAYDSVQRFVKRWKSGNTGPKLTEAFVPMAFAPGDACQFDWSQEQVELGGVMQTIKVAHFPWLTATSDSLCHSTSRGADSARSNSLAALLRDNIHNFDWLA